MKKIFIAALSLLSLSAFSADISLDGLTFCRKVRSDGWFGQPVGIRSHCVQFENGRMTDYANTFFGNPPETYAYHVVGYKILNAETNAETGYEYRENGTIVYGDGHVVMTEKKESTEE